MTDKRYRHEYKYRLDACQAAILKLRAAGLLQPDGHVEEDGAYLIQSLYFDDSRDSCLCDNEEGYDKRYKFRIRYYNRDTDYIRLEKKSKVNGLILKESCVISEEQCRIMMSGEIPCVEPDMPDVMKALFTQMRIENMKPKIVVLYERIPFVCALGNVRVTFDGNLRSSCEIERFLEGVQVCRPVLRTGESLMEVKWDELLPSYIRDRLELDGLQWSTFSKYYLCRKYDSRGGSGI